MILDKGDIIGSNRTPLNLDLHLDTNVRKSNSGIRELDHRSVEPTRSVEPVHGSGETDSVIIIHYTWIVVLIWCLVRD